MNAAPHFLKALDEQQFQAVTYNDGPLLVIAGAGSGKTRVLTCKIAYLLALGVPPHNILALTFTNKAAREMNQRIHSISEGTDLSGLWSGTFHSLFARILRREADKIGHTSHFTIYDAADTKSLLKTIINERGLDDKVYKPATIAAKISEAKNRGILPDFYAAQGELLKRDKMDNVGDTYNIYAEYVQRCRRADAMDFDDLLLNAYLLLRDNAEVQEHYRSRFQHILVDEYQDTNHLQHLIIGLLTHPTSHLCVVGDDAQSIYAFRGANIDNILKFQNAYPTARLIKLECNYRSTQQIVGAANSIISHNKRQIEKTSFSRGEVGEKLRFTHLHSDREEAERLVMEVKRLHAREQLPLEEIAVLYRTNAQSRVIEDALRSAGVPHRIYGGLSFYARKEIKDCLAYLRLICNPLDEEALKRIINYPARGIGATTLKKLQTAAVMSSQSLWEVLKNPGAFPECNFNKGTLTKLQAFTSLIEELQEEAESTSAYELAAKTLARSGITLEIAAGKTPEDISRRENVEELLASIKEFEVEQMEEDGRELVPISEFLSQVSLLTDADQNDDDEPKITLMTIHASKGLEFGAVFITGLEDNLFPSATARHNPREMEEERRLFYVAVTRAKKHLFLSAAMSRFKYGQVEFSNVSPFVAEISKTYLETATPRPGNAYAATPRTGNVYSATRSLPPSGFVRIPSPEVSKKTPLSATPASTASSHGLSVGGRVLHERFGLGKVLQLEGTGVDARALVDFQNSGVKRLLLKFAKLRTVGN